MRKNLIKKEDLTIHEPTHTFEKLFKCNFCETGFFRKEDLTRHTVEKLKIFF